MLWCGYHAHVADWGGACFTRKFQGSSILSVCTPEWWNGRHAGFNGILVSMSKSKYTKDVLEQAVAVSKSVMEVLDRLGLARAGGNHAHISRKIKSFGIDTAHFTGQRGNAGKPPANKRTASELLVLLSKGSSRTGAARLRRALQEIGRPYKCELCGLTDRWQGSKLTLEVDHIDGDWLNNLSSNLRFLCPNCHSQQITTNKSWKNKRA